jgi:hypothetical protein
VSTSDVISREQRRSISRRLRWTAGLGLIVPLYLAWEGIASFAFGAALLLLPRHEVSSPTLSTLYRWVTPNAWGVIFLLLSITCLASVIKPKLLWRHALLFLWEVQATWSLGLAVAVAFNHTPSPVNILAPIVWFNMLGTTVIVFLHAHRFNNPGRR